MSEPSTIYAVFDGFEEMYYGYPPNLRGLFTTRELAEQAMIDWREQAQREKAGAPPGEYRSTFEPLYVAPVPLHAEDVPPMPDPGRCGIGTAEWLELYAQGKV